jgi:predicted O-methyltransferase YrrM
MDKIKPLTDTQYQNQHGEVYPWFTLPCLEWLNTLDLSDKNILEYGSGASTFWFAKRCKHILSIEANAQWYQTICNTMLANAVLNLYPERRICNEGEQERVEFYTSNYITDAEIEYDPDIIIVDGILRNECLKYGIQLLSKQGGIIIADNWQQREVWISEEAEEIMKPYKRELYVEPSRAHEVNPWTTAVFHIPKCL